MDWSHETGWAVIRALVMMAVGVAFARLLRRGLERVLQPATSQQKAHVVPRFAYYAVIVAATIAALSELGFDLKVLVGAAGVLTVALGFASQTSASNLISGLFLLAERPFVVGDAIKIGETTGVVLSLDLLSVKLRTYDNLLVRVPNETLLKAQITNLSHFPIRRADILLGVAYKENIERVRKILLELADENPLCLDEPAPIIIFRGYGESSIDIQFSVWAARPNFLELKNTIQEEIKTAFDAQGVEIPFPHRTLYAGSATEPFPVRVVGPPSD